VQWAEYRSSALGEEDGCEKRCQSHRQDGRHVTGDGRGECKLKGMRGLRMIMDSMGIGRKDHWSKEVWRQGGGC
jgi:hypothetical protein